MKKYVDTENVMNEIKRFVGYLDEDMILRINLKLGQLPAADVRPVVRGRWNAETSEGSSKWKCSCCGGSALLDDYEMMVTSAFCPHCGARMEGAECE